MANLFKLAFFCCSLLLSVEAKWDWSKLKELWYKEQIKKMDLQCDSIPVSERLDCFPEPGSNEQDCVDRGCCWSPAESMGDYSTPYCFYSGIYEQTGYQMGKLKYTNRTFMQVDATREEPSFLPNDVLTIRTEISYETETRLRLKIYDPNNERYEVPQKFVQRPVDGQYSYSGTPKYMASVSEGEGYQITIQRRNGPTIMKSTPVNFIFADQYLQMSFFESGSKLYGVGEHRQDFMYNLTVGRKLGIWARDQPLNPYCNEYGAHPMYVLIEDDGQSHGVVLMNSNGMDVTLQPGNLVTWRTIGGILDFYVLVGPTPNDVVKQYFDLIGRPYLPPYWGLGFHLCKYNYGTSEETWTVVNRTRAIGFPQEVQWNDIDYMDYHMDFTYSQDNYSTLPEMVADLHANNQRYIMILDPGIYNGMSNAPLLDGNKLGIWINQSDGVTPLEGIVWPGTVYYPDFTNHKIDDYWAAQLKSYHDQIPFDGVWIDMNEPSNFVDGSTSGCSSDSIDNPPYTPHICDQLVTKTICLGAKQEAGLHYNVHSMYGHTEGISTNHGLKSLFGAKRPVIISRSTFMSSGRYVGHWTGDNTATWDDLKWSISSTLNSNLFGISFTGADVCGFQSDTTEELCTRWMQMGAFYTFYRNHNDKDTTPQDPAVFSDEAINNMKHYAFLRYKYLPYLYAEMFKASTEGATVLTSLAFEFSHDTETHPIDTQFLWGHSVMVVPVLTQGATQVSAYFPKESAWYALENPSEIYHGGAYYNIDAPLSKLPLFVRAGSVLVSQKPEMRLTDARLNNLTIEIFMPIEANEGVGWFVWDDGESDLSQNKYSYVKLDFHRIMGNHSGWVLTTEVLSDEYVDIPHVESVIVHGLDTYVSVYVDQFTQEAEKYREEKTNALVVEKLDIDLTKNLNLFFFVNENKN